MKHSRQIMARLHQTDLLRALGQFRHVGKISRMKKRRKRDFLSPGYMLAWATFSLALATLLSPSLATLVIWFLGYH